MKNISILFLALSMSLFSCKNEENKTTTTDVESENTTEAAVFVAKPVATTVSWTAYKTTDKTPVKGKFTQVDFEEKSGNTVQETLNNLSFSIPISSLFTQDTIRDGKIKTSFFGAMLDTELISGTLKVEGENCVASLTMNGVTHDLPLEMTITEERRVALTGIMQLKDWNALEALNSLNKVCFDLHKGPDGVSKTWEEVKIEASIYLRDK